MVTGGIYCRLPLLPPLPGFIISQGECHGSLPQNYELYGGDLYSTGP
jgi:hypothetical protein